MLGINGQAETFEEAKRETKKNILRLFQANTPLMPEPRQGARGLYS